MPRITRFRKDVSALSHNQAPGDLGTPWQTGHRFVQESIHGNNANIIPMSDHDGDVEKRVKS